MKLDCTVLYCTPTRSVISHHQQSVADNINDTNIMMGSSIYRSSLTWLVMTPAAHSLSNQLLWLWYSMKTHDST